jgi:hypothetical protein
MMKGRPLPFVRFLLMPDPVLLAAQIVIVKTSEGGGFWSIDANAVLVAGVAAFAALLATISASLRQKAQLQNDRVLRWEEERRNTLDSQVEGTQRAFRTLTSYHAIVSTSEERLHERRAEATADLPPDGPNLKIARWKRTRSLEEVTSILKEWDEARNEAHEAGRDISLGIIRLRLRFGEDSPVTKSYAKLMEASNAVQEAQDPAFEHLRTDAETAAAEEVRDFLSNAYGEFAAACWAWFQVESQPTNQSSI